MKATVPPLSDDIARAIDDLPVEFRPGLLSLRAMILAEAAARPEAGPVTEALRWGQPAYLASRGSTIRIGCNRDRARFALFFHCRSAVIPEFRDIYGDAFRYDGNRAILFDANDPLPDPRLQLCIGRALTYRVKGKPARRQTETEL